VIVLILAPLSLYLLEFYSPEEGILIDGNFQDWDNINEVEDPVDDQRSHPDINLVKTKMAVNDNHLSMYFEVKGNILEGRSTVEGQPGKDTVRIFIDSDANEATGYSIYGLGADYMTEVQGQRGRPISSSLYMFDIDYRTEVIRHQNDWNAWNKLQNIEAATRNSRLEVKIPVHNNGIEKW
jgi:hypothetical protein